MASKVAPNASIIDKQTGEEKIKILKPSEDEKLINEVAGKAVQATMKEFMPMFGKILEKVANKETTVGQANKQIDKDYRSAQARVIDSINKNYDARIKGNKRFLERLANSPKSEYVTMSIPRVFAKYFGSQLLVGLNGSTIQVPVNGRPFKVHKLYVPIIKKTLNYKDQKIAYMEASDFEDISEVSEMGSLGT